jgi:cobalt-zinc-cadmium efflux system outer membrane protein
MTRRFRNVAAATWTLLALAAGPVRAQETRTPPAFTLAEAERLALASHPRLAAAEAERAVAEGRARQAAALPNPVVGYTGDELGGRGDGAQHGVFVEQIVPLGGTLRLRREVIAREAEALGVAAGTARAVLLITVRQAYYAAVAAAQRVEVRDKLLALTDEGVVVARQLFNIGSVDRPDVLTAEIARERAKLAAESARLARARAWSDLRAAIGQTSLPEQPLEAAFDASLPALDRASLVEEALLSAPEVRAAEARLREAEAAVASARRERAPELEVKAGPHSVWQWEVKAGIRVPLFDRFQGGTAAAIARRTQAAATVQSVRLDLERRMNTAYERFATARAAAESYRAAILPRAEEAYALYLTKYREMAAAYPQVLLAEQALQDTSEQLLAASEAAWQAAAELRGFAATGSMNGEVK